MADKPFNSPAFGDEKEFDNRLDNALGYIKTGTSPEDAIRICFNISRDTWYKWKRKYLEEVADGWTRRTSRLVLLFEEISKADLKTKSRLEARAVHRAETDESTDMLKFVLERRYGYVKKSKKDVEVGTKEDTTFNINITESKPRED